MVGFLFSRLPTPIANFNLLRAQITESPDSRGNHIVEEHSKQAAREKELRYKGKVVSPKTIFRYAKRLVKYTRRVLKEEAARSKSKGALTPRQTSTPRVAQQRVSKPASKARPTTQQQQKQKGLQQEKDKLPTDPREPLFAALKASRSTDAVTEIEAVWDILSRTSDEVIYCGEQFMDAFKIGMQKCEAAVERAINVEDENDITIMLAPLKDGVRCVGLSRASLLDVFLFLPLGFCC